MKHSILLLFFLASTFLFSCSSSDSNEPDNQTDKKLNIRSVSIVDGSSVDASKTSQIFLDLSDVVVVASDADITLNKSKVEAKVNQANAMQVIIEVTLTPFTSYTLHVAEGAICSASGQKKVNPELTLNFDTNYGFNPADIKYDTSLINKNATESAKTLYNFLLKQNGKKVLSGVSAGGGNDNVFADWVASKAGTHAAVAGYDFLFHKYSGQNWIDYNDNSAPISHWKANGIVAYNWHWNVPTDEEAYKNKDYSRYAFYVANTNFDINRALEEGTWENKVILEDIDQIAGYLKVLQEAGVAVLWRPLHEAAGSHIYNNPWFWWGKRGSKATIRLWKLMYERLVNHHGVNNLIWVWTAQYDAGKEAEMKADYPGNEWVDIVGVDSYRNENESAEAYEKQLESAFGALADMTEGRKLLAVSECGYMTCLGEHVAKTPWAWFMVWNSDVSSNPAVDGFMNTTDWYHTVFNSQAILNREDMPSH